MDDEKVITQVTVQKFSAVNKNGRVYNLDKAADEQISKSIESITIKEYNPQENLHPTYDRFINQDMNLIYDSHAPRPTECRFGSLLNPDPKKEKVQDILKNFGSQLKEYAKLFSDDNRMNDRKEN